MNLLQVLASLFLGWLARRLPALPIPVPRPAPAGSAPPASTLPEDTPYPALVKLILTYNAAHSPLSVPEEGVLINRIDDTQAIAAAVQIAAASVQLHRAFPDIFPTPEDAQPYVCGCLGIEGCFDTNCVNQNIGVNAEGQPRSNPNNEPLLQDLGMAQLKGEYLVGRAPGVIDAATARTFSFDVTKAVPYFVSLMIDHIAQAKKAITENPSPSQPDPRMNNPLMLGTWIYNEGPTGYRKAYDAGEFPSHCQKVLDLTNSFAGKLGVASVFASLAQ